MHESLRLKARQCREDGVGGGGVVSRHPPPGDALAGVGGIRMGRQVAQDGVDDLVEVIFLNPHAPLRAVSRDEATYARSTPAPRGPESGACSGVRETAVGQD